MPDYPFFTGIIQGAVGKTPQMYSGVRRTAASLGFSGTEAQSTVAFHDRVTYQAAHAGLNYVIGHHPDPQQVAEIWSALPSHARANITDFAWNTSGQMIGGSVVSMATSRALVSGLRLPRQIVLPAMFIINMQGAMAALWRDG